MGDGSPAVRVAAIVALVVALAAGALLYSRPAGRQDAAISSPAPAPESEPEPVAPSLVPVAPSGARAKAQRLVLSPHFPTQGPMHEALMGLLQAQAAAPEDRQPAKDLALFLFDQHEYRAAQKQLKAMLAWSADTEAVQGLLGMTHVRLGRLQEAAEIFEGLTAQSPESWNGHYHRGLIAFKRQQLQAAVDAFQRAASLAPRVAFPHHDLGVALYKAGRAKEALPALQRAAQWMPDHGCVHFDLMNAYRVLGLEEADDREHREYWARRKDGGNLKPIEYTVDFAVDPGELGPVRFRDVAGPLGLDNHGRGRAGVFVDYDGDGDLDILTGNLEERSRVYRNQAQGESFRDVTEEVGLGDFDSAYGLTLGDYDNDGDPDLYVTRGGFQNGRPGRDGNLLFQNRQGRFFDVTEQSGVGDTGTGFGSVWADFDQDGWLDLYVVNNYTANRLFRNRGDGSFEDVTEAAGVGDAQGGISAAVADYDGDGDPDIYVANNGEANLLYRNDGNFSFSDVTKAAGVGVSGGFASVAADFDNDGQMDIYVSNMNNWFGGRDYRPNEPCYLFINQGGGRFEDRAKAAGVDYVGGPMGLNAADYDYDGWVDLYLGNGGPEPRRWEPDVLYRNRGRSGAGGKLRFANVTRGAGTWNPRMGHGLAFGDYDRDGDLDIYVPNGAHIDSDVTPNLLWQNQGHSNHWLVLALEGVRSNRSAIGARAVLYSGDYLHVEEVSGGSGFGAQGSLELEFGLGQRSSIDRVEIRWPSGLIQTLNHPPIDRFLRVVEGEQGWKVRP